MKYLKQNPGLFIIMLTGFILRIFYAHLDPYLHEWDERFHALVARNMMDNPFVPLLRKAPLVPYDLNSWCCNSVWLHKQPLFMWQMALSMKVFGANLFAMRYPSAMMGVVMIFFTYRITQLFTSNKTTSLIAALIMCFSHYQLEMVSGQIGMDHNDVAFGFYILASFWALTEKIHKPHWKWDVLIGVFAGCAILNKWLTGLLVFLPLGMYTLQQFLQHKNPRVALNFFVSLICCIVVFLPWQLYILHRFHDIAVYEYAYNSKHLWEAVEGHDGSVFYYLLHFDEYFGYSLSILIAVGMTVVFLKRTSFHSFIHWALLISFFTVLLFFSLVAQSKLTSYFFIVAPIGFIYIAIGIQNLFQYIAKSWLHKVIIVAAVFISFNPYESISRRIDNPFRKPLMHNTGIYKNLKKILPPHVKTIVNMNSHEEIDVMFYNNDINAYMWCLDINKLDSLKNQKIWIGAFKNHGNYRLPAEMEAYPYLYKIDTLLQE